MHPPVDGENRPSIEFTEEQIEEMMQAPFHKIISMVIDQTNKNPDFFLQGMMQSTDGKQINVIEVRVVERHNIQ